MMETTNKHEENINYAWFLYFCRFVPTDAKLSLQKISWHTNLNKITDNNTALLTHLHVWSVDKTKKEENETDFQGMSYPFQKKKLVITINILNELKTWMKKLVKVFKNLMSVICYMCTSSVVYMQSPTASLISSHPYVDMLDRADVLDALFVPSWHLWWPIAASFWGEGPSQCSSYTAICKEENSGIASLWAPRGHMTHSVAFTSVACRSSALDVLVFSFRVCWYLVFQHITEI